MDRNSIVCDHVGSASLPLGHVAVAEYRAEKAGSMSKVARPSAPVEPEPAAAPLGSARSETTAPATVAVESPSLICT
ncbi:hypothetical protein [Conyzicola sp.]|uniref:hypothetical protein n=1 Tax=Conyzicola sp. TaxID=1969404 RepID=UPI00398936ED